MESADATNITSDHNKRALDAIERRFALKKESEQHNKRIRERSLRQKENNDGVRDSGQGSSKADIQSKKENLSFFPNSSFQGCHKVSDEQNQHPTYHKLSENVHENLIKFDTDTPSKVGTVNEILHDLLRNGDFSQNYMKGSKGMKIDNWFSLYNIVPNQVTATGARVKVLQNHSKRSKNHMSTKQHKKHGSFDFPRESRKFNLLKPIHEMWKDYIVKLLKQSGRNQIHQRLLSADLHGAILMVVESKITEFAGTYGIMVRETAGTFGIITEDDKFRSCTIYVPSFLANVSRHNRDSSFITLDTKSRRKVSRHNRSKSSALRSRACDDTSCDSAPSSDCQKLTMGQKENETEEPNKVVSETEVQSFLKREIQKLEERLKDQFMMRCSLEKALGYKSAMIVTSDDNSMPKPTKELIREIAELELEVMYLEHYLLSLYRKTYDQQNAVSSAPAEYKHRPSPSFQLVSLQADLRTKQTRPVVDKSGHVVFDKESTASAKIVSSDELNGSSVFRSQSVLSERAVCSALMSSCDSNATKNPNANGVCRSQSALSQRAVYSALMSPHPEDVDEATYSFHSEPLSSLGLERNATSQLISLAECLGTRIADHVPETPNRLSEDLVRCMGSIYCKLVEPCLIYPFVSSTPTSSFSSTSALSPQCFGDSWSPVCRNDSSLDGGLENPFQTEGLREFNGPYNAMIEVCSIGIENHRMRHADDMLKTFRSLTQRLEKVDVKMMKNEEKLAFWINIHNALVMHAYVLYDVPQHDQKRSLLHRKVSCNVGSRMINPEIIQSFILGHRTHRPGQWIRTLLSPRLKLKGGDEWQALTIEQPEPLLHFALCSGHHSDPAVRIYSPKRVYQQLETAKEEYIRAVVSIHKEQKILLPRLLESFAKDSSLSVSDTVEMIQLYLPEKLRVAMERCQVGRSPKCIEWVPHNFTFRYLMSRELAGPLIS